MRLLFLISHSIILAHMLANVWRISAPLKELGIVFGLAYRVVWLRGEFRSYRRNILFATKIQMFSRRKLTAQSLSRQSRLMEYVSYA